MDQDPRPDGPRTGNCPGAGSVADHNERTARRAVRERDDALALLDTVLASAPVGVALHDRRFRVVRANPMLAAFVGRAPAAIIGHTFHDLIPDQAGALEELFARVTTSGIAA